MVMKPISMAGFTSLTAFFYFNSQIIHGVIHKCDPLFTQQLIGWVVQLGHQLFTIRLLSKACYTIGAKAGIFDSHFIGVSVVIVNPDKI